MISYSKNTQYRQRPKEIELGLYRVKNPRHDQLLAAGWHVDQLATLGDWQRHTASPRYAGGNAFWDAEDVPIEQIATAKEAMVRDASAAEIDAITGVKRPGEYSRFPTAASAILDREMHNNPRPEDPATADALRELNAAVEPVIGKERALLAAIAAALTAGDRAALIGIEW